MRASRTDKSFSELGKIYFLTYEGNRYVLTMEEAYAIKKFAPYLDITKHTVFSNGRFAACDGFEPKMDEPAEVEVEIDLWNPAHSEELYPIGYTCMLDYDGKTYMLREEQFTLLCDVCPDLELYKLVRYNDGSVALDMAFIPIGSPISDLSGGNLLYLLQEKNQTP